MPYFYQLLHHASSHVDLYQFLIIFKSLSAPFFTTLSSCNHVELSCFYCNSLCANFFPYWHFILAKSCTETSTDPLVVTIQACIPLINTTMPSFLTPSHKVTHFQHHNIHPHLLVCMHHHIYPHLLATNLKIDLIMSKNNTSLFPSKKIGLFCCCCGHNDFGSNQQSLCAHVCYCSFNPYSNS